MGRLRIAYVCYWNAYATDGVTAKVATQVAVWRQHGHEVRLFVLTRPPAKTDSMPTLPADELVHFEGQPERLRATAALVRRAQSWCPDVVYLRYDYWHPPIARLVRELPTVVEVNSGPGEVLLASRRERLYEPLARALVLRPAAGFVFVAHELVRLWARPCRGRPFVVIGNGVDLDRYPSLPPPENERPRLAFLGVGALPWYGLDKLLDLAHRLPEADFDLIGTEARELPRPAPANVSTHGVLPRSSYERLLRRADVAVSSLALHRKGQTEVSLLKTNEYLAYGLPVILAHEDTNLLGREEWFLLRIPNTEDTIERSLLEIRSFLARVKGRRVPREAVADAIDAGRKERERLAFLEAVARVRAQGAA